MTYDYAMEARVSKAEAAREIRKHGTDPKEFFAEVGEREFYDGADVLGWLGY